MTVFVLYRELCNFRLLSIFGIVLLTLYLSDDNKPVIESDRKSSGGRKTILVASSFFGHSFDDDELGKFPSNCPAVCHIHYHNESENLNLVAQSDAILFHMYSSDFVPALRLLLPYRKTNRYSLENSKKILPLRKQIWAFFAMETTSTLRIGKQFISVADFRKLDGIFNWSISFRKDSTIWTPYHQFIGFHSKLQTPDEINYQLEQLNPFVQSKMAIKKRHLAAVISNCDDSYGRLKLLRQLQSFGVKVDIYGSCSPNNLQCPGRMANECYKMLEEKYFFYASFENSMCKDYVTEKLINIFRYSMVPVVINGANVSQPSSYLKAYINGGDFQSVRDLAEFLIDIASDEEKYKSFFTWKEQYGLLFDAVRHPLCGLCVAIQDDQVDKQNETSDFKNWMDTNSGCQSLPFNLT